MSRVCLECGFDISHRHSETLRCDRCAREIKLRQTRRWHTDHRDANRRIRDKLAGRLKESTQ